MAAKKKVAKKKASKAGSKRKRQKNELQGNLRVLAEVGVFDAERLTEREINIINNELTDEEVAALISAYKKLVPPGEPAAFVCF